MTVRHCGSTLTACRCRAWPSRGASQFPTNPLQIGGDSIFGQFFTGTIDEVRVYNTALNQSQIQTDMATPVGSGGSLPLVSLSSPTINFGSVSTGSTSPAQPVTLTNTGGVTPGDQRYCGFRR